MIDVIYTLVGIVFGFSLDWIATYLRERRVKEQQIRSVRAIISLEIDQNLDVVKSFWSKLNQYDSLKNNLSQNKRELAQIFVKSHLSVWQRNVFVSQMYFLPTALSEAEIIQVFHFYDRLNMLDAIRTNLTSAFSEQENIFMEETSPAEAGYRSAPLGYSPPQMFNEKADELWNECRNLFAQTIARGNPLRIKPVRSHQAQNHEENL